MIRNFVISNSVIRNSVLATLYLCLSHDHDEKISKKWEDLILI